jgi:hypothetical protein
MPRRLCRALMVVATIGLLAALSVFAADESEPTEEQFKEFVKTAKVENYQQTSKGVTAPFKLTLSDGSRTMVAAFQPVDESKSVMKLPGRTEFGFRDSYRFNLAAYELAKLLGLESMIPVTVEYKWRGRTGSLSWWIPAKWDESDRLKQNLQSPDIDALNKQLNRMWVFSELIYDTDRNQTNMLFTEDWKLWIIDFTRAFRLQHNLESPGHLIMCDRALLEKLRQLNEAEVLEKTKLYLSKSQVKAVMARRDKIVAYFEQLVTQKGEDAVLY